MKRWYNTDWAKEKYTCKERLRMAWNYEMNKLIIFIMTPYERVRNFILVTRFPFLKPSCGYGTDMEYHKKGYRYHYESTWLDGLPRGWRKDFGIAICKEIREAIRKYDLKDYAITQVKEKFGELRWYDMGGNDETNNIIDKYEKRSREICINCGRPAVYQTTGWIGYYCSRCAKKFKDFNTNNVTPIK